MKWNVKSLIDLANKAEGLITTAEVVLDKMQGLKTAGGRLIERSQSLKADNGSDVTDIAPATNTTENAAVAVAEIDVTEPEIKSETPDCNAVATDALISDIGSVVTLASGAEVVLALEAVNKITEEVGATIRYCEEQQTRREEIVQSANVQITQINRMTELIKVYLDKTFDERSQLFDNYFGVLDRAIADGNLELMSQTLAAINSLAVSSPFKDLADINNVAKGLSEGTEWDI